MKNYLVINGTEEPLTPAQIELINFIADPYAAKDRVSEFENIFFPHTLHLLTIFRLTQISAISKYNIEYKFFQ